MPVAATLLPRRPDVYHQGRIVDRFLTVSGIRRLSFWWDGIAYQSLSKKKDLEAKDLPRVMYGLRAECASEQVKSLCLDPRRPLWKSLFLAHKGEWIQVLCFAAAKAIADLFPSVLVLIFLQELERKVPGAPATPYMWLLLVWHIYLNMNAHVSCYPSLTPRTSIN